MKKRRFQRLKGAIDMLSEIQERRLDAFLASRGLINGDPKKAKEKYQELDKMAKELAKAIKLEFFLEGEELYEKAKEIFGQC